MQKHAIYKMLEQACTDHKMLERACMDRRARAAETRAAEICYPYPELLSGTAG